MIQKLAWPLHKDDTQIHEMFHISKMQIYNSTHEIFRVGKSIKTANRLEVTRIFRKGL